MMGRKCVSSSRADKALIQVLIGIIDLGFDLLPGRFIGLADELLEQEVNPLIRFLNFHTGHGHGGTVSVERAVAYGGMNQAFMRLFHSCFLLMIVDENHIL